MNMNWEAGREIHGEHLRLIEDLAQLERGLDRLECYAEVFANLAGAEQVRYYGHRVADELAGHFRREEKTVLATASQVSPELGEFCSEMKGEHSELLVRLSAFRAALDQLERGEDLNEAIYHLKEEGKELTHNLRRHVAREEQELSGIL